MGTETLTAAQALLYYAPWCLTAAGVLALLVAAVRFFLRPNKDDKLSETVERSTRVIGFTGFISVLAAGAVAGVTNFVAGNPGQVDLEQDSSGSMLPSNDWWKPSAIGSNNAETTGGGTNHANDVIGGLRDDAEQARGAGDTGSAEELEARAKKISDQNTMLELTGKALGVFHPGLKPLLNGGTDALQNLNADAHVMSKIEADAAIKTMQWFR